MRFVVQPYVTGVPAAPLIGVPLGGPIVLDAPESPQLGDVLPPLVPGHGPLTVRHRAWRHDGASLVLVVEATCRREVRS